MNMSHCTIVDCNNYMREVCVITISKNKQIQIGHGKLLKLIRVCFQKERTILEGYYHKSGYLSQDSRDISNPSS